MAHTRLSAAFVREPLVHFLVLGAAVCAFSRLLGGHEQLTLITITPAQIRSLKEAYRIDHGGDPTKEQLQALVDDFIKEEIFYREALKLGLDAHDQIIRRRLAQKYEFLQLDTITPAEPTERQLHDFYQSHLSDYMRAPTVSFSQLYFSPDVRGDEKALKDAETLAAKLNRLGDTSASSEGDRFPGETRFASASPRELSQVFGREGLANAIFRVRLNQWSAPLKSGMGWHIVFVTARHPAEEMPFKEIRETVRLDYLDAERHRQNAEAFRELRANFRVVQEPTG